jgi:hypothetical protein
MLQKLSTSCIGPYPVTQVYNNATVQIQKGIVSEWVNIRWISPSDKYLKLYYLGANDIHLS